MKKYLRILAIAAICGTMAAPQVEARGNRTAQSQSSGVQSRGNSGGGRAGGRAGSSSSANTRNATPRTGNGGTRSGSVTRKDTGVGTPNNRGNHGGNANRPGSGNVDRPNHGGNHGGNANRPGSGNVDRPNHGGNHGGNANRPGSGNVDRPNHGGNHGGNANRPGSGNVDRPNHGGNHGGNVGTRPGNGGTRPGYPGSHNSRPGNNPGHHGDYHHDYHNDYYHNDYHHSHYRPHHPTPPPHRPHYGCAWTRPCPPHGWRLGRVYPTFTTVLGITLGSAFDVSIAYLFDNGYNVYSYGNDIVYLSNVNQLNLLWPDASLYYGAHGLNRGDFVYSTSYYDTMRYNEAYARLVAAYGAPVSTTYPTNGMQTCWFGNDGRFVTLQFMPTYGADGILRYYTTLSFGL